VVLYLVFSREDLILTILLYSAVTLKIYAYPFVTHVNESCVKSILVLRCTYAISLSDVIVSKSVAAIQHGNDTSSCALLLCFYCFYCPWGGRASASIFQYYCKILVSLYERLRM